MNTTENWKDRDMTRREILIVIFFLTLPIFIIGLLTIAGIILAVMPREQTRRFRRYVGSIVMRQWEVGSNLSSVIYSWLWQKGNGH
jgi:hypothetical protein